MDTSLIPVFLIALMCVAFGVMVRFLKWHWLIAGYNTMSRERKRQVNVEGLGRFMGNSLFLMAGIIVAGGVLTHYKLPGEAFVMPLAIPAVVVYMLIRAQRFDAGALKPDGTMKLSTKLTLGSVFVFFAVIGIWIYSNTFPSEVVVGREAVQIKGRYAIEIKLDDINEITLEETLPVIFRRTNGFSAGGTLKGHFLLQDIGRARLYVNVNIPPFIYLDAANGLVIVNQESGRARESSTGLWQKVLNKS